MPFQDFSFTTMKCRRVFTTTLNAQRFLVTWSSSMRYFSTSTASFIFCPAVFYATFQPLTTSVTTNWDTVWINVKPLITSFDLFKKKLKPGFYFCCWWVVVLRFRLNFITLPLNVSKLIVCRVELSWYTPHTSPLMTTFWQILHLQ